MADGTATLTVVGCSGSVPGPDGPCSCYLVQRDGHRLLLDLGTGAVGPLQRLVPAEEVDEVFVTHAHPDHWSDLWDLMYLRDRVGRTGPLTVHGPPQVRDRVDGGRVPVDEYFTFQGAPKRMGPWEVRTATVAHSVENWAVRLDDALCYTGDTDPCPELDELAHGCAVLLAEATGFDDDRAPAHLSAGDAGRLATKAGARLLVLTHLRAWHDHRALLAEAAREATCPVVLARPGLTLSLGRFA